ncbi:amidohydrolase family protein [Primorskyibacter flagellatus]|uniref:Cytosine deaminase n=1 Tax=Primorskyibacter flagellatus TaxID=1387277 RepID=A0A1W2CCK2_9RHOB|nr:amidohydrolase family protein [Primorskyibacter flagellatus]SMC82995.1 cytosine deaminase [Primorskyibacter flagellatus]
MKIHASPRITGNLSGVTLAGQAGTWDLTHSGGRIAALRPSRQTGGGMVLPLMADIHVHLDKTMTIGRMPRRAASLFDAIEMMGEDAAGWTEADMRRRVGTALARAYRHGTALMRSHLDWNTAEAPLAWPVLTELAQEWRGRIDLQLASLTALDLIEELGPRIAPQLRAGGGVMGAFVYRNADMPRKIALVFDLAEAHGLDLDFHVDEGLEPEAQGFDAILDETERRGMAGRVLCGHGCSLSVRDPDQVLRLLERAAHAGVGLTVLPGANSYLQDAQDGRTPRLRGIAPLQEARAAGMPVMIASDNVQDGFFPFGDHDLWDVYRLAVLAGHLPHADWLDAITSTPAHWMGQDTTICEGGPASFIRFESPSLIDALSRPSAVRQVWRDGQILLHDEGVET